MAQRIPAKKAQNVLETLMKKLPLSRVPINGITASILYDLKHPSIYTPTGPPSSLVALVEKHAVTNVDMMNIFWDPEEKSDEEVHDFLVQIPDINWKKAVYLRDMNLTLSEKVHKILSSPDLIGGKLQKLRRNILLSIVQPKAMPTLEVPEGFEVRPIEEKDIPHVLNMWYQRPVNHEKFLANYKNLPSVGIYEKNKNLPPRSFFLTFSNGFISAGHTDKEYRRLGLSELALIFLTKFNLDKGLTTCVGATVERKDSVVKGLMKNGYQVFNEGFHEIHYSPDDPSVLLPFY